MDHPIAAGLHLGVERQASHTWPIIVARAMRRVALRVTGFGARSQIRPRIPVCVPYGIAGASLIALIGAIVAHGRPRAIPKRMRSTVQIVRVYGARKK